jgi:hypothetical protein
MQAPEKSECATLIGGARPAPAPSLAAAQETLKLPCMIPECGSQKKR